MKIIISLFVVLGIACMLLPSLLSTEAGKELIASYAQPSFDKKLSIGKLSLSWQGPQVAQDVLFKDIQGKQLLAAHIIAIDEGLFTLARKAIDRKAKEIIDIKDSSLFASLSVDIDSIPSEWIAKLYPHPKDLQQLLIAFFGPEVKIEGKVQWQGGEGPLHLKAAGAQGQVSIKGNVGKNAFFLDEPLQAQTSLSPDFIKWLQQKTSFPQGLAATGSPLSLLIDPEGFVLPLDFRRPFPVYLSSFAIGKGKLTIDRLQFSIEAPLAKKVAEWTSSKLKELAIEATPLYFSVKEGVATLLRQDFLVNSLYPLSAWGKIDILSDDADLIIALSGAAINKLKVSSLPNDLWLQIPVSGPLDNLHVEGTAPAARLATLMAYSQGSLSGILLGTALQWALGSSTEKTPKPTTSPLPWEDLLKKTKK